MYSPLSFRPLVGAGLPRRVLAGPACSPEHHPREQQQQENHSPYEQRLSEWAYAFCRSAGNPS